MASACDIFAQSKEHAVGIWNIITGDIIERNSLLAKVNEHIASAQRFLLTLMKNKDIVDQL